jgi:hypothetical protein
MSSIQKTCHVLKQDWTWELLVYPNWYGDLSSIITSSQLKQLMDRRARSQRRQNWIHIERYMTRNQEPHLTNNRVASTFTQAINYFFVCKNCSKCRAPIYSNFCLAHLQCSASYSYICGNIGVSLDNSLAGSPNIDPLSLCLHFHHPVSHHLV